MCIAATDILGPKKEQKVEPCTYIVSDEPITPELSIKVLSEGNDTDYVYRIQ